MAQLNLSNDDLLAVGGQFTAAGSGGAQVSCNNVAGWEQGQGWNNLDGGITPETGESVFGIYGLSWASDGKLYIGGDFSFDATGTVDLNKVAYFSDGRWNAMGSGLGRSSSQIVNGVATNGTSGACRASSGPSRVTIVTAWGVGVRRRMSTMGSDPPPSSGRTSTTSRLGAACLSRARSISPKAVGRRRISSWSAEKSITAVARCASSPVSA